jgi:hypothetical protein
MKVLGYTEPSINIFFYVIKFWIFLVVFESIEEKSDKKSFEFGLG